MRKIKIAHVLDSVGGVEVYLRLVTENIDSNRISCECKKCRKRMNLKNGTTMQVSNLSFLT